MGHHHHHHPITFKDEGVLSKKSPNSKNILGWSPIQQANKITRWGRQDQGNGGVHHDQEEGYKQPKSFKSESGSVPQDFKEVSHLEQKIHFLVRNRSNTIPWA